VNLSHRSKLLVVVIAALVLPSILAWGVRAVTSGSDGDRARTAAERSSPAPTSNTPTPPVTPSASPSALPSSSPTAPSSAIPSPQVEGPATPAQQAQRLPTSVVPEPPAALRLPGGKVVRVVPTRTGAGGSLGIPDNLHRAGWWRGGARLGDPFGSMLVAAHVDAVDRGLGPFVVLLSVRRGARFTVASNHLTQDFRVTARRLIARDRLARARWVSSFSGPPRLTLVTCAPPYIRSKGGYQRLAVVVASPVGPPRARR
jgi:hypothetical protein